ncbi:glycosyltransferase family 2 protein [Asticcacaulis tiandongensis]|uniref:glycosyltransferase family 2 protein n=1 Tax=Asticcacaulis tiandongensis TaxID=2565365 RepID=UPI0011290FED|nr:glycosyltransferase [Asticcacaulis tiandongensis]
MSQRLRIAIGIATAGRRNLLSDTVRYMARQTRLPDEFLICPARPEDVDSQTLSACVPNLRIVNGPVGSSHQRNAIMDVTQADVVVFFDDDFLPAADFLEAVERLFSLRHDVVVATGDVLADGISGPGLDFEQGRQLLEGFGANNGDEVWPVFNGYGCNMAVRMGPVRENRLVFDEMLPLYAWLEDVDFSRQMAYHGEVVKATQMRGVHLGNKASGRSPGKRLGYSQIANRIYIKRKGSISWWQMWYGNFRNLFANTLKSIAPEPWVDRRGRLTGNIMALIDWGSGQLNTKKILEM